MKGAPGAGAGLAAGPPDEGGLGTEWAGGVSPGSEEIEKSEGDPEGAGTPGTAPGPLAPAPAAPGVPDAPDAVPSDDVVPDPPDPPPAPGPPPEPPPPPAPSDAFCVYQAGGA